ncbi:hypothetical protein ACFL1A_00200 [Patescibacteria group bacterium]
MIKKPILDLIYDRFEKSDYSGKNAIIRYLLKNNIGYYFVKKYKLEDAGILQKIILHRKKQKEKFVKTLKLISDCTDLCGDLILFKTLKQYEEIQDGDIDVLVGPDSLNRLIDLLSRKGFNCVRDSESKYECTHKLYSKIEPRSSIDISKSVKIYYKDIFRSNFIYKHDLHGLFATTSLFDNVYMLFNYFFGPRYIRLYDYMIFMEYKKTMKRVLHSIYPESVTFLYKEIEKYLENLDEEKIFNFPLYVSAGIYFQNFGKYVWNDPDMLLWEKIKHPLYLVYMKAFQKLTGFPIYYHKIEGIDNA